VVHLGGALRQSPGLIENKLPSSGWPSSSSCALLLCGPLLYHTNQVKPRRHCKPPARTALCPPCAPGAGHPLGRIRPVFDLLGRLMFGGKNSLIVGFVAAAAATLFGVVYGPCPDSSGAGSTPS